MLVEGRGFELQVWNWRREGNKICRGERERERRIGSFFLTNLGDFGSSVLGILRIGFCSVG
jgi:hypothetical protein